MIEFISSIEVMLLLGLLTHILKDVLRVRVESGKGSSLGLLAYFTAYPIQAMVAAIGSLVGAVALNQMGELTPLTAYGVGYMANSMADIIGKRTATKFPEAAP